MGAQKNFKDNINIIAAQSMGANIPSGQVLDLRALDNFSVHVKWTSGNAIGVIAVEASNNYVAQPLSGSFAAVAADSGAITQPASNSGEAIYNYSNRGYSYIRVTYTRTSGTGTLNVWVTTKEI